MAFVFLSKDFYLFIYLFIFEKLLWGVWLLRGKAIFDWFHFLPRSHDQNLCQMLSKTNNHQTEKKAPK